LKLILSGNLLRQDIEIVIARHDEDINWSDMYSSIRTVYDKPGKNGQHLSNSTAGKVVRIPNLGRESYTYLYHVVNNYYSLAEVTVFTQATAPPPGYFGHRSGGGHLYANSSFHDFVLGEDGWFVFTAALWLPTLAHVVRTGYNKGTANRLQALESCPTPRLTEKDGSEYKFDLDDRPHLALLRHIASRCSYENSTTCQGYSFWDNFIRLPRPNYDTIFFGQGAIFAATREQIQRRPLQDYQRLLQAVSLNEDPSAGFFLEWMWYYVITSDVNPCPLTGTEFQWAKERSYYKSLPLQERVQFTNDIDLTKKYRKKRDKFCLL
jgi:hypothetical protein